MAEQGTAVQPANIDNAFAATERQLRANRPFFGAVSRIRNGQQVLLDYVKKDDRLTLPKWLEQKDIDQGQFLLETQADGDDLTIEFMVDKNADSSAANPFFQNMPAGISRPAPDTSAVKDELEAQVLRLKNEVEDASRKRRQAEDELYKYKRENTDETGDLKNEHRNEVDQLKENHRQQVDSLKDEIRQKDWEIKLKEMELMSENGGASVGNRLLDMLQSNLNDDFFANLLTMVQQQTGGLQNATPQQLQGAFHETAAQQMPQQNGPQEQPARNNPEPQEQQLSPEEQMQAAKKQIADYLKDLALSTLMGNVDYGEYVQTVQKQLALNNQQGIQLDARQWVEMAKMLAEQAVQKEIKAEKVAKIIKPALGMLPKQALTMAKLIKPQAAANQLFNMYNINASGPTKDLVVDVLDQLLNPKKSN